MSAHKPIKKAVFPVAGLGTRFLPATKAIPKELLPIVDRPLIQYAVDEAREAGIEQIIFVTGRGKTAIVEHFDMAFELETTMDERGKDLSVLDPTRATPGDIITVRQQVPLGLGHAIWCARAIVGDEPFAILLPDELMVAAKGGGTGCMKQTVEAYEEVGGNLISVLEVPQDEVSSYGVIAPGAELSDTLTEVTGLVEKPPVDEAPSNKIISGRYILQPEVMRVLRQQDRLRRGDAGAGTRTRRHGRRGPRDGRAVAGGVGLSHLCVVIGFIEVGLGPFEVVIRHDVQFEVTGSVVTLVTHVAHESVFQFDVCRIHSKVNQDFSNLIAQLDTCEVLNAPESDIIIECFLLYVVTAGEEVVAY